MLSPTLPPFRKRRGRARQSAICPNPPTPEDDVLTGTFLAYGGATPPAGYLDCDGSAVSRTTYAALFAVLGTAYGSGDGVNTFNVPDFRGRALLGAGAGAGLTPRSRGEVGGEETHVLTVLEIPAHEHGYTQATGISVGYADGYGGSGYTYVSSASLDSVPNTVSPSGGGAAHQNMPPFGVARWIVKA